MDSFLSHFSKPNDSRLYIDLIKRSASHWASYDPASQYELGDYGRIDLNSGRFIPEGNVLEENSELKAGTRIKETPDDTRMHFASRTDGTAINLAVDALPELSKCDFKWGWHCNEDRHAALICRDPVLCEIACEGRFLQILNSQKSLRNKAIITKLIKCTSYALLLTNATQGTAYAGFNAGVPNHAGVEAGGSWTRGGDAGTWLTGLYSPGEHKYFPLFTLQTVRFKRRGRGASDDIDEGVEADMPLAPYPRPWGKLDVDGLELDEYGDEDEDGDGDH